MPEVLAADHHHGPLYQESLLAPCQENKIALAAELAIHTEDVILTWVSEQQILVRIYRPWGFTILFCTRTLSRIDAVK